MIRVRLSWPILTLTMAWALVGCTPATGSGAGGPPRNPLSWLGASGEDLQQDLGPPNSIEELPSGEKVMAYRWSRTQIAGGYAVSPGGFSQLGTQYVPERMVSINCFARFTIDANDQVRDIALRGNGCLGDSR
jgi:hypothetical protein